MYENNSTYDKNYPKINKVRLKKPNKFIYSKSKKSESIKDLSSDNINIDRYTKNYRIMNKGTDPYQLPNSYRDFHELSPRYVKRNSLKSKSDSGFKEPSQRIINDESREKNKLSLVFKNDKIMPLTNDFSLKGISTIGQRIKTIANVENLSIFLHNNRSFQDRKLLAINSALRKGIKRSENNVTLFSKPEQRTLIGLEAQQQSRSKRFLKKSELDNQIFLNTFYLKVYDSEYNANIKRSAENNENKPGITTDFHNQKHKYN